MPLQNDHAESLLDPEELALLKSRGEPLDAAEDGADADGADATDDTTTDAAEGDESDDGAVDEVGDATDGAAIDQAEGSENGDADAAEGDAAGDGEQADDAEPEPEPDAKLPAPLRADDPAAMLEQRKALRDELATLKKQWRDGEISDEAFDAREAEIEDQREQLLIQATEATTVANVSRQQQQAAFESAMSDFMASREANDGINYKSSEMLRERFTRALGAAATKAQTDGTDPSAAELFRQADAAVRAEFAASGITLGKPKASPAPAAAPAPAPAAAPAPAPRKPRAVPTTLAAMPAAAPAEMPGDALLKQLSTLQGEDLEIAWAKLPADQRRKYMQAD